jgi:hypothetical protein
MKNSKSSRLNNQPQSVNFYRRLGRGNRVMTILPAKYQKSILRRLKPSKLARRDSENDIMEQHMLPLRENEYFTFSKDGNLIDVDDEAVVALERKISDNWRQEFLANSRENNGD